MSGPGKRLSIFYVSYTETVTYHIILKRCQTYLWRQQCWRDLKQGPAENDAVHGIALDALRKQVLKSAQATQALTQDEDGAAFRQRRAGACERCSDFVSVIREIGAVVPTQTGEAYGSGPGAF